MSDHGHAPHDHGHGHGAHGHAGHDHGPHGHDDHGGIGKYVQIFVALCVLTGASFFTYSDYWPYHDTPSVGWVFMMAVSCTKALLVMLFFMHLKYEADWKYVLTIPASIMSVFLVLALVPDIGRRVAGLYPYNEARMKFVAHESDAAALVEASLAEQHHAAGGAQPAPAGH